MINDYLEKILEICCDEFDITMEQVKSETQILEVIYSRKAFCLVVQDVLDLKNEITGKTLDTEHFNVSYYLKSQPENKYYKIILERVRNRVKSEIKY